MKKIYCNLFQTYMVHIFLKCYETFMEALIFIISRHRKCSSIYFIFTEGQTLGYTEKVKNNFFKNGLWIKNKLNMAHGTYFSFVGNCE